MLCSLLSLVLSMVAFHKESIMIGVFYKIRKQGIFYLQVDTSSHSNTTICFNIGGSVNEVTSANHLAIRPKDCVILGTTEDIAKVIKELSI